MRVLLTGATGFVGRGLLARLSTQIGLQLRAAIRRRESAFPESVTEVRVADMGEDTDWRQALEGVEVVIHSAARAHIMDDQAEDPLAEFRAVNVAGTLNLARQAARAGVKRFVFISSIKVNGEGTALGKP